MNLSYKQIKEITLGAVNVVNCDDGISFLRFTEPQQALYANRAENFWKRSFCTSGIKLSFRTNSKKLSIKIVVSSLNTRDYFSVDVFANNKIIGYIDNFSQSELPEDYTIHTFPLGEFSKLFQLDSAETTVCIHFPWSVKTVLQELSIDDNAFIEPIKPTKRLLAFGDSITQGYDALRPSNRYISKLADYLDAEEINKAIGGERFFPELAVLRDSFSPEYIVVAYGTNDWNTLERGVFQTNCKSFFDALVANYPESQIIAITPIWRANMAETRPYGNFKNLYGDISSAASLYHNITVINGFEFVSQNTSLFADQVLHPNDKGFELYYKNLTKKIAINLSIQ